MKKWSIYKLVVILILSIPNESSAQKIILLKTTHLGNYPSASSLEFYNKRLYIIGDDATRIMIADNTHTIVDSISVFQSKNNRIDKDEKADLESSVLINRENKTFLVAFSSFSTAERNKTILIDLQDKTVFIKEGTFKDVQLKDLNIEGAAIVINKLLLSNRANNTNTSNHFILTDTADLQNGMQQKSAKIIKIVLPSSKSVVGISGITYLQEKDLLLFSASTENTSNSYTDGAIGNSYIGLIKNISALLCQNEIKVDKLISLSPYISKKTPQKIESVAIEKLIKDRMIIHLAADNDNGESTLFKMSISVR